MTKIQQFLQNNPDEGQATGLTSICSSHPVVIEAAFKHARGRNRPVLIESTCNQVNQDGGYTGMTPLRFRKFVEGIANSTDFPIENIILGGDHLGPNPWKHLPAEHAMEHARKMTSAYTESGFSKLHLDTSMSCLDDPEVLPEEEIAARAAELAGVAEANRLDESPVYVLGTEVPSPGGVSDCPETVTPTEPESVISTHAVHKEAFERRGLRDAFNRVIAIVVQPGVEFGHSHISHFNAENATELSASLANLQGIVFEAHSTDYQSEENLRALVSGGFAILKVGPWLTFAMREALYALDALADTLEGRPPSGGLISQMDEIMLADPVHWNGYYAKEGKESWLQRHFSYSDRIRYYWPKEEAKLAVESLLKRFDDMSIPAPVFNQFFPQYWMGEPPSDIREVLIDSVSRVLDIYDRATAGIAQD